MRLGLAAACTAAALAAAGCGPHAHVDEPVCPNDPACPYYPWDSQQEANKFHRKGVEIDKSNSDSNTCNELHKRSFYRYATCMNNRGWKPFDWNGPIR